MTLEPIRPVKPVAAYVGGKRNLSAKLVAMIAATPHDLYIEPFVGMGGVFLRRTMRPRTEVINDTPEVRALFGWARLEEVRLSYRLSGKATPARELIISSPG